MSIQTKNRKERRRFTKLMSLVLSASLVFGNVAIAYANPNDADMIEGASASGSFEVNDESQLAARDDAGASASVNISSQDVSVNYANADESGYYIISVNAGTKTVSGAYLNEQLENVSYNVVLSKNGTPVSENQKDKITISFNEVTPTVDGVEATATVKISDNEVVSVGDVSYNGTNPKAATNVKVLVKEDPNAPKQLTEDKVTNIKTNVDTEIKNGVISVNSANEINAKYAELKIESISINGETISAGEFGADKKIQVAKVSANVSTNSLDVKAEVSVNDTQSFNGTSYNGTVTVPVATIKVVSAGATDPSDPTDPTAPKNLANTDVTNIKTNAEIKDGVISVNSANEIDAKYAGLKIESISINGEAISAGDFGADKKVQVNKISANASANSLDVKAEVSVNGTQVFKGVSYNGNVTVSVATIKVVSAGTTEPSDPNAPKKLAATDVTNVKTNAEIKDGVISVNSANEIDARYAGLTIESISINGEAISAGDFGANKKVQVKKVSANASSNSLDVKAEVSVNGTQVFKGVSFNGNVTVPVATIKVVSGNQGDVTQSTDIKDVAVTVTGSPASSTVASQAAAKAKADSLKPSKVTVSGVSLTADQLKNVTVKFAVGTVTTTSKDNVTATVTINKPIEVNGVTYTGTKTVTKTATIKLAPATQSIKLNKAADKAISFTEGKKGTKTITIKNVKTSLKVTVTKADQKKIKATVQKGNKIKIDSKKKAGTATVKIQAISNTNYKASNTLTVKVTIVPKKKATGKVANVKVVSKTKKVAKVTWKKPAKGKNINGYEVQYASSKKALKNGKSIIVKGAKKKSVTIKKLASKKKVYVRVRPVYIKNGATNPSKSWSAVKNCKVK